MIRLQRDYKMGEMLWGYAFLQTSTKESLRLLQKPVKGMILPYRRKPSDFNIKNPSTSIPPHSMGVRYFIPLKKNSEMELAWSKAVSAHARHYADTEAEAIADYNRMIDTTIDMHRKIISELQSKRI